MVASSLQSTLRVYTHKYIFGRTPMPFVSCMFRFRISQFACATTAAFALQVRCRYRQSLPFVDPHVAGKVDVEPTEPDKLTFVGLHSSEGLTVLFHAGREYQRIRRTRAIHPLCNQIDTLTTLRKTYLQPSEDSTQGTCVFLDQRFGDESKHAGASGRWIRGEWGLHFRCECRDRLRQRLMVRVP